MITIEDIENIVSDLRGQTYKASKGDITFALLSGIVGNEVASYLAFNTPVSNLPKYIKGTKLKCVRKALIGFGLLGDKPSVSVAAQNEDEKPQGKREITKEENREALMAELDEISRLQRSGDLDAKDAVMARARIRFELNKNFEMDKSDEERRLIVVPQKNDMVCPHTHRECSFRPTKKECMEHYHLKEA